VTLSRPDVVLHPVRSRLVRAFVGSERRTATELSQLLPDVPQASLYRHLNALVDGNVLRIVEPERRGGGPRGYALAESATGTGNHEATVYLDDEEFAEFTRTLSDLFNRAAARLPAPGRRRRLLATVAVPLDAHPV
jgi:hypothetical protein